MYELYPLKFKPILKDKIWGGSRLNTMLLKAEASSRAGESWEISGLRNNVSLVADGFLEGNELTELLEVYMGDLVGDQVYDRYGNDFPLLIKFIDANDTLSLQVHPDDDIAYEQHGSWGKTEMWYIIHAEENAEIISGFREPVDNQKFISALKNQNLSKILYTEKTSAGDVFFIPAGRVHAISSGILLAEIQQSSDITYRIYDWDRTDEYGKQRELHIDQAMGSIDFNITLKAKTKYQKILNQSTPVVDCEYFKTNLIHLDSAVKKDFILLDSFIIYICTEGEMEISYGKGGITKLRKGETLLIPACLKEIVIMPSTRSTLLEVYINQPDPGYRTE